MPSATSYWASWPQKHQHLFGVEMWRVPVEKRCKLTFTERHEDHKSQCQKKKICIYIHVIATKKKKRKEASKAIVWPCLWHRPLE
ncbi:hypothetical protein llap_11329 [Limosa lapponica baueri]|uniref:Uncharacterized protein n=1 Tax=Limosa lapponica baueri TaxID=1758121 RepID=A0A2I0TX34_LIMLA|nr:hypothetical protein llap_11329 [Limosa lapponica baueri]